MCFPMIYEPKPKTSRHASEDSFNSFSGTSRKTNFEESILDTTIYAYTLLLKME